MFKTICVDHVGIACKDLDLSKKFYTEVLGLSCTGEEAVPEQGVKTVFIPCGETLLELLVDITENGDGPIGKYIAKNGQGIQHIAVRVDDVQAAIDTTIEKGAAMIDKAPRGGAGGRTAAGSQSSCSTAGSGCCQKRTTSDFTHNDLSPLSLCLRGLQVPRQKA